MKTAVYSGSFNPLHTGHLAIMRFLIEEAGFDRVRLVVSPKNPLKAGISSSSGPQRHEAALKAVGRHADIFGGPDPVYGSRKVIVDSIELSMPEPHYTIRTLDALREMHPEERLTLVMGADNLGSITKWRSYIRILTEYGVIVYPRKGFCLEQIKHDLENSVPGAAIEIMNAPEIDISSTEIREAEARGTDMSEYLM
ncbi:MAG: nicotinate-nicotinamide nucleotide adenylyltransferase [Bacteroidales bacterium]|nr:nicotinate-nicotinamide nucleotide adenylyltransferase [Bacteroidales bacterium]